MVPEGLETVSGGFDGRFPQRHATAFPDLLRGFEKPVDSLDARRSLSPDGAGQRGRGMDSCDVLIVGGGPAGSSCAWGLRESGLDAVILDQHDFPRDKICGGWITPEVLE